MAVKFSALAQDDLRSIQTFIASESPQQATHILTRIMQSISILGEFPDLGRPGRVSGTRELKISNLPFIAVYKTEDIDCIILAVIHERQRFP